jgi:hypothetical protein
MNTQHWLYRLSRAYLIGVAIGGMLVSLTLMPMLANAGVGFALGVVGWQRWTWYKNMLENNNNKR